MATQSISPQDIQRVGDTVYVALRDGILNNLFSPGERLNVTELAKKLNVSVTPVKDGLNRLAVQGLIQILPRRGTFVTVIDAREVSETFDLRRALELLACETAVLRVNEADIERLSALLTEMERPVVTRDDELLHLEKNSRFHKALMELSGNKKLLEMYELLNAHLKIARVHSQGDQWVRRLPLDAEEHRQILAALAQRDIGRLQAVLRIHITTAKELLIGDLATFRNF